MSSFELVQKQTLEGGYDLVRKQTLEGDIAVSQTVVLKEEQEKSIDIIENGEYSIKPDLGKTLSEVNVNVDIPSDAKEEEQGYYEVTTNGTKEFYPSNGKVFSEVTVKVNVGDSGTDTSDATVTADDLAKNVVAYGKDGKVVGNVDTFDTDVYMLGKEVVQDESNESYYGFKGAPLKKSGLLRSGVSLEIKMDKSAFGTASVSDVVKGKTFTSVDGFKVEGTHVDKEEQTKNAKYTGNGTYTITPDSGKTISQVNVQVNVPEKVPTLQDKTITENGTYSADNGYDGLGNVTVNVESEGGIDTSDATVTASDLAEGVIAYGKNGERVVGNVYVHTMTSALNYTRVFPYNSTPKLGVIHKTSKNRLFRKDSEIEVYIPYENFGTATPSDVAKGKTFTSAEGYLVEGTREGEGGSTEFTITDDGNGNVMISGLSVANDGNGNVTIS